MCENVSKQAVLLGFCTMVELLRTCYHYRAVGLYTINFACWGTVYILINCIVLSFSIHDCGFEVSLSSTGDKDLLWLLLLNLLWQLLLSVIYRWAKK